MSEIVKKSDIPRTDTTEKLRQRYNLDNITKLAEKLVYPVPIECGGTNADNIEGARDNLGLSDSSVGLKAYPVGAVYISFERTSPAALFGGTWTQLTNRFLYAANGSGATGGESTNTLVFIKEDVKNLSFGDDRIREAIVKCNAKLLILDPMSSYIGETCSMNNANETRAEFNHLIAVAKETGCAIVIIAHMNKAKDTSPLYRTNGSIDIAGAARSILAVTQTGNKDNPAERYLVQVKCNLAPMGSGIVFEVAEEGVNFTDEIELTADEAFSMFAPRMGRPNEKLQAAEALIRDVLKDGKRMLAGDCEAKLEADGFKKSTIKKAKKRAGVVSHKDGFSWYWYLPMGDKLSEETQDIADDDDLPF